MIRVKDYMSEHTIAFPPDKSVGKAIEVMKALDHDGLPVIAEERGEKQLVGIITLKNLIGADPDDPIERVMTKDLVTVTPEESIVSVAGMMAYNHIHHLPVVEDGRLVGFLTTTDILRACVENMISENVERIIETFRSLNRHITVRQGRTRVEGLIPTQKYLDLSELQLRRSEFNKGIIYPIIITKKNGKEYIIDGHHRAYVAYERGIEEVPVFIIEGNLRITETGDQLGLTLGELEIIDL